MKYRTRKYLLKMSDSRTAKKTTQKFLALMFMLVFMLIAAISQSQSPAYAKLNASGAIVLPTEKPLDNTYIIDMSAFHFSSDEEMIKFLSTKSNNMYALRARTATKEGVLVLQRSAKPDWNLKQWNDYFLTEGNAHPLRK